MEKLHIAVYNKQLEWIGAALSSLCVGWKYDAVGILNMSGQETDKILRLL